MSFLTLPSYGFTLTLPDATTLVRCDDIQYGAGALEVPSNCRTIVVYNMDAAQRIFVKYSTTNSISQSTMTLQNSTVIPAGASMTFAVGYLGDRPNLSGDLDVCLFFKAEAGTSLPVNVTYLMGRGTQLL